MQSTTSEPLPGVSSAFESDPHDVDPSREAPVEPEPAIAPAPSSRYFAPGDYEGERDWWAKQLGRESQ